MKTPKERLFESATQELDMLLAIEMRDPSIESPIEIALWEALVIYSKINFDETISPRGEGVAMMTVKPQVQIENYRVDFLLTSIQCKQTFVIECDGHDFHERTKEQAAKDRSRDRELTALGYRVLRFTGSEIWRDPWGCADQICQQIYAASHQELGPDKED